MARKQLGVAPSNAADTATKGYVDTATTNIVTTDGVQSLSNKTINSPTINNPEFKDGNNKVLFHIGAGSASAVNYIQINNAASTGYPSVFALGSDTDIGIDFYVKGAADVKIISDVGSIVVSRRPSVPSSTTDTGRTGQVAFDSSHAYFCTAPNTWRRVALSTW